MPDVTLSIADVCSCCCPSGFACFQAWTASYSCATNSWTGPTAGAKTCLAVGTSQAWVKTSGDGSGCAYARYVRMPTCCTVDGDCTGEADTDAPALPFGGGAPDDCPCPTCADCLDSCPDCIDAISPTGYTVILSGFGACDGHCVNFFAGTGGRKLFGSPNGTYPAPRHPSDCVWSYVPPGDSRIGPITTEHYASDDCTGDPDPLAPTDFEIEVTPNVGGSFLVRVRVGVVYPIQSTSPDGYTCCEVVSWAASCTFAGDDQCGCGGGTITLVPCITP